MSALRACLPLLLLLPFSAFAQIVERADAKAQDQLPSRWSAGLAVVHRDSEYAGEGTRTRLYPNIAYDGDRFYLRGATFGYRAYTDDRFEVRTFIAGRLDGLDADDFGVAELARRGVDRRLLSDRDDSVDVGVGASWKGAGGKLDLDARIDVSGTSDGYAVALDYSYPLTRGRTTLVPSIGAVRLSADMADYYYGILDEEVARGVVAYRPGAATVPRASLTLIQPFARRWALTGSVEYRALPDALQDSPLVEAGKNSSTSLFVGLSRGF
ncbi:MipA/OmpV family protein [Pseudoxanthomonas sp.]|uniref:MipA/OmpV family protein n=1 Tax=Pseudoxanthomonas sp. TaxID=1871049 RepID=UPI002FE08C7D